MKKTICFINQYATTPDYGMGGRSYYLASELAKQGHQVYLIAASFSHIQNKNPSVTENSKVEDIHANFKIIWLKVPKYEKAHSKQRVLNWFIFSFKLLFIKNVLPIKIDCILYSSPALIGFLSAKYLSAKFNSRLIFDVRDIWPLTLTEIGNYKRHHPFIMFLQWIEKKAYKDSDLITSNLKKISLHCEKFNISKEKIKWIPNGIKINKRFEKISNSAVQKKIPKDKFIVGYIGTIGLANAIDTLLGAAQNLVKHDGIHFVVVGDGNSKKNLEFQANEKRINNITFIDAVPKNDVPLIINCFDACFIGSRRKSIYQYGLGANKIPEYMISKKPLILSYSGACNPVIDYDIGVSAPADDSDSLAKAIIDLYEMPQSTIKAMGERSYNVAMTLYNYELISKKLAEFI
ncbi:glycosyltransferase family 4 protein [Endozoicomonadaceae bacterium StTr2]